MKLDDKKLEERIRMNGIKHKQKIQDETFRVLNHFEKVIKKKDTINNFVKVRKLNNDANIELFDYFADWSSDKTKAEINKLINQYQKHDCHFCYIQFLGDKTKPGFDKYSNDESNIELKTLDVPYKYGIIVYYIENHEYYRFIFVPVMDEEDISLKSFSIIDNHYAFNFIKIDKPLIKKEMKRDSSLHLLISLPGGGYASIPENRMRPIIYKEQRLINDYKLNREELKKAVYYEGRKCPRCKKGKTNIRCHPNKQLYFWCSNRECGYHKELNIRSHKEDEE